MKDKLGQLGQYLHIQEHSLRHWLPYSIDGLSMIIIKKTIAERPHCTTATYFRISCLRALDSGIDHYPLD